MGFQHLKKEERIRIASRGGSMAWAKGKAYRWTREKASEAGKRGGGKRWLKAKSE